MAKVFWLGNLLPLPFWVSMIVVPNWRWTRRLMASPLVVAPPAVVYVAFMAPRLSMVAPTISRPTLSNVASLLGTPEGATAGWLHMMMADLFVGRWIYLDARARGLDSRLISPVLGVAMIFSPAGLLMYLALRRVAPGLSVHAVTAEAR